MNTKKVDKVISDCYYEDIMSKGATIRREYFALFLLLWNQIGKGVHYE